MKKFLTESRALVIVLRAVKSETDSYGSPNDNQEAEEYLKDPEGAPDQRFGRVGGIPLDNPYVQNENQLRPDDLWDAIDREYQEWRRDNQSDGANPLAQPSGIDLNTTYANLADSVSAQHRLA